MVVVGELVRQRTVIDWASVSDCCLVGGSLAPPLGTAVVTRLATAAGLLSAMGLITAAPLLSRGRVKTSSASAATSARLVS